MTALEEILEMTVDTAGVFEELAEFVGNSPGIPDLGGKFHIAKLLGHFWQEEGFTATSAESIYTYALSVIEAVREDTDMSHSARSGLLSAYSRHAGEAVKHMAKRETSVDLAKLSYRHFRNSSFLTDPQQREMKASRLSDAASVANWLFQQTRDIRWLKKSHRHNTESISFRDQPDRKAHGHYMAALSAKLLGLIRDDRAMFEESYRHIKESLPWIRDQDRDLVHRLGLWVAEELGDEYAEQQKLHEEYCEEKDMDIQKAEWHAIGTLLDIGKEWQSVSQLSRAIMRIHAYLGEFDVDRPEDFYKQLSTAYYQRFALMENLGDPEDLNRAYDAAVERAVHEDLVYQLGYAWRTAGNTARRIARKNGSEMWWERAHDHFVTAGEYFLLENTEEASNSFRNAAETARYLYEQTGSLQFAELNLAAMLEALHHLEDEDHRGYWLGYMADAAGDVYPLTQQRIDIDLALDGWEEAGGLVAKRDAKIAGHHFLRAARVGERIPEYYDRSFQNYQSAASLLQLSNPEIVHDLTRESWTLAKKILDRADDDRIKQILSFYNGFTPARVEEVGVLYEVGLVAKERYEQTLDVGFFSLWHDAMVAASEDFINGARWIQAEAGYSAAQAKKAMGDVSGAYDTIRSTLQRCGLKGPERIVAMLEMRVQLGEQVLDDDEGRTSLFHHYTTFFQALNDPDDPRKRSTNLKRYNLSLQLFDATLDLTWARTARSLGDIILWDIHEGYHPGLSCDDVVEEQGNLSWYIESIEG